MALRRIVHLLINDKDLDRHQAKFTRIMTKIRSQWKALGGGVSGAFKIIGSAIAGIGIGVAVAALTKGIIGLGRAFGQAQETAREFERQLARTQALVDDAEVSMEKLKQEVILVAKETGIDRVPLAKALFSLVSAGIDAANALDVLRASSQAAVVDQNNIETVLLGTTRALNGFGLSADRAKEVAETLFVVVRNNTTTFNEIAGSIGRVAPLARSLNISLEETVSAMGAITQSGASTETAFLQLRGIFTTFIRQAGAFRRVGIDITQVLSERGLAGAFDEIREKIGTSAEALQPFFQNSRIITGVLALLGAQADDFAGNLEDMENKTGTLDEAFRETSRTAAQLSAVFDQQLAAAMDDLAEGTEGVRKAFLEIGIGFLRLFRSEAEKTLEVLEKIDAPRELIAQVKLEFEIEAAEERFDDLELRAKEAFFGVQRELRNLVTVFNDLDIEGVFGNAAAEELTDRIRTAVKRGGAEGIEELRRIFSEVQQLVSLAATTDDPDFLGGLDDFVNAGVLDRLLAGYQELIDANRILTGGTDALDAAYERLQRIMTISAEINRLLAEGYAETSDEIMGLRRAIAAAELPEVAPDQVVPDQVIKNLERALNTLDALRAGLAARTEPAFIRPLLTQIGRLESSLNKANEQYNNLLENRATLEQIDQTEALITTIENEIGRLNALRREFAGVADAAEQLKIDNFVQSAEALLDATQQSKAFADVLARQKEISDALMQAERQRLEFLIQGNTAAAAQLDTVIQRLREAQGENADFVQQFPELTAKLTEFVQSAEGVAFDIPVDLDAQQAEFLARGVLENLKDTFSDESVRVKFETFIETGSFDDAEDAVEGFKREMLDDLTELVVKLQSLGPKAADAVAFLVGEIEKIRGGITDSTAVTEAVEKAINEIEQTFAAARTELEIEVEINPELNEDALQSGLARAAQTAIQRLRQLRDSLDDPNPATINAINEAILRMVKNITSATGATSALSMKLESLQPLVRSFRSLISTSFGDTPILDVLDAAQQLISSFEQLERSLEAIRQAEEAFKLLSEATEDSAQGIEQVEESVVGIERVTEEAERAREAMEELEGSAGGVESAFTASFGQIAAVVGGVVGVITGFVQLAQSAQRLFRGDRQTPEQRRRAAEQFERETDRTVAAIRRNTQAITARLEDLIAANQRIGANLTQQQRDFALEQFNQFRDLFNDLGQRLEDLRAGRDIALMLGLPLNENRRLTEEVLRDLRAGFLDLIDNLFRQDIIDQDLRDSIEDAFTLLVDDLGVNMDDVISALLSGGEEFDAFIRNIVSTNTRLTADQRRALEDLIGSFDGFERFFEELEQQFGQFPRTIEGAIARFRTLTSLLATTDEALQDFFDFITSPDAFGNVVLSPEANAQLFSLLQEFVTADQDRRREIIDAIRQGVADGTLIVEGFTGNELLRLLEPFLSAIDGAANAADRVPTAFERAMEAIDIFRNFVSDDPDAINRFVLDQLDAFVDAFLTDFRSTFNSKVPTELEKILAPLTTIAASDPAAAIAILDDVLRQIGEALLEGREFFGLTGAELEKLAEELLGFRLSLTDAGFEEVPSAIMEAIDALSVFSRFVSDDPVEQLQFLIGRLRRGVEDVIAEMTGSGRAVSQELLDFLAPLEGLEDLSTEDAQAEIDRILREIGQAIIDGTELFGLTTDELEALATALANFRQGLEAIKPTPISDAVRDLQDFARFVNDDVRQGFDRFLGEVLDGASDFSPELAAILEEARNLNLADPAQQQRLREIVEALFTAFRDEGETFGLDPDQFRELLDQLATFGAANIPDPQGFERTAATIRRTVTEIQGNEIVLLLSALLDRARQIAQNTRSLVEAMLPLAESRVSQEAIKSAIRETPVEVEVEAAEPPMVEVAVEAPEAPVVNVNVETPEVEVPEVSVTVEAAEPPDVAVTVEAAPAPDVTVNVEPPVVEVPEPEIVILNDIDQALIDATRAVESLLADLNLRVAVLEPIPRLLRFMPDRIATALEAVQRPFGEMDFEAPAPEIRIHNEITINESDVDAIARALSDDVRRVLTRGFRPR